jgi:hypothetical protein
MAFKLPQNGVVALWETETRHQPLRRPPSGSMTDQLSEFAQKIDLAKLSIAALIEAFVRAMEQALAHGTSGLFLGGP